MLLHQCCSGLNLSHVSHGCWSHQYKTTNLVYSSTCQAFTDYTIFIFCKNYYVIHDLSYFVKSNSRLLVHLWGLRSAWAFASRFFSCVTWASSCLVWLIKNCKQICVDQSWQNNNFFYFSDNPWNYLSIVWSLCIHPVAMLWQSTTWTLLNKITLGQSKLIWCGSESNNSFILFIFIIA